MLVDVVEGVLGRERRCRLDEVGRRGLVSQKDSTTSRDRQSQERAEAVVGRGTCHGEKVR